MQRVAKHLYRRGNGYTFRRVIPPYAQGLFGGKREYVVSLGDVSLRKAQDEAAFHRAHCNRLIEEARGKSKPLRSAADVIRVRRVPDQKEIERAVRAWLVDCEGRMAQTNGGSPDEAVRDLTFLDAEVIRQMRNGRGDAPLTTRWIADELIERNDWRFTSDTLLSFLEDRVARGQRELASRVKAEISWGDAPQPTHRMFAPGEFERDRDHQRGPRASVSFQTIFKRYLSERKPAADTVKAWTSAVNSLTLYLGHDDAARVTPEDIVGWKDFLLSDESGSRSAVTVRHKYLGAVKPIFGFAERNKLIAVNPVVGVTVTVPKRVRTRATKGFTDAEAKQVLSAALAIDTTRDGRSFVALARRWLPWLCAYTGARVGEMAQLRRQDVAQNEEGIWFLTITPEAGSQKGGFARQVAVHPHLIEQGFIEAIKDRTGPLFYDPDRKHQGSTGNAQHKKMAQRVADWVRKTVGVTDPELQPNHGWRHRFITIARDIRMDEDVRRAITGHKSKDEHGDYGDTLIRSSYRWLSEFPRYEVQTGSVGGLPSESPAILQPVATAAV